MKEGECAIRPLFHLPNSYTFLTRVSRFGIDTCAVVSYDAPVPFYPLANLKRAWRKAKAMNHKPNPLSENDLPKLAAPAQRALDSVGIHRLDQLTPFSEQEIKQLHGIGPNALNALRRALKAKRKSFAKEKK